MRASLILLAAMVSVAYAVGQYYVPRSYYTIDSDGHETAPVPLRRLRRSLRPYPAYNSEANANANADAHAEGGDRANANANANADARAYGNGAGAGGVLVPLGLLGSSRPNKDGFSRSQSGQVEGRSVSASTSVGVDSSGRGYYDQTASVGN